MWGTYLHDISRSQATARIYSSERWTKFRADFGNSPPAKKFWAHFHDLCIQKRSCFPWSWDTFFEFCAFNVNKKCFGRIFTIYASKNEEFCCQWDAFWKFSACKICKNIFWCIFTIYAPKNEAVCREVQTDLGSFLHGCILSSPLARFAEKSSGCNFTILCHANEPSWLQHFVKKLWSHFTILHAHKSLLCCSNTLWSSWLSHFIRTHCFESEHIWTTTAPTNCDVQVWLYAKQFQKILDWHLRHLL